MNEAQTLRPFIPSWLDDAGLPPAEFRLYCHLLRRADKKTGIAWPSYESMSETCGTSRATIWRCLKSLATRGMIAIVGKPFGGSRRYQVLAPIVSPEARLEDSNSITTGTIETAPIVSQVNSNRSSGETSIVSPEAREGIPLKGKQERKSNNIDIGDLLKLEVSTKMPSSDQLAESIYQEYPRKVSKLDAIRAIQRALKTHPAEYLLEKVKTYTSAIGWKEPQFIPYPATWFNKGQFNDDPAEWQQPAPRSGQSAAAAVNPGRRRSVTNGIQENIELI